MRPQSTFSFFSLQWRLTVHAVVAVVFALSIAIWMLRRELLETESRAAARQLELIVRDTALQLPAETLTRVRLLPDGSLEDMDAFIELSGLLKQAVERFGLTGHHGSPIYVLWPTADPQQLEFVVMPRPDETGRWFVGNRYPVQPHLMAALQGEVSSTGIYRDQEGQWISAAAPIRDAAGRVIAVIQADRQVDFIRQITHETLVHVSANLLAVAIVVGWGAALVGRRLSRPLQCLTEATERLAAGELSHRVENTGRRDELGRLARSLNRLAGELECARQEETSRQEALRTALRESEVVSRSKDQFIAVTSHEMRTPLTAIVGFARILLESPLPPQAYRHARLVLDAGESLMHLVNELLDQSKIEAGSIQVEHLAFSLDELADLVVDLAEPQTVGPQNMLFVECGPEVPPLALGSPKYLQQVLLNLVSNAIKFAPGGWVCLRISAEPAVPGDPARSLRLRFEVADNGIGIGAEHLAKIFSPFYQVASASNRAHGGVGLGLSIASGLVRAMGGEIRVESEVGRGTRFWFELPLLATPAGPPPGRSSAQRLRRIAVIAGHGVPAQALATRLRRVARLLNHDAEVEVLPQVASLPRDPAGKITRFETVVVQSCTGPAECPRGEDGHWHPACGDCGTTPPAVQQVELKAWRDGNPAHQLWLSTPAARRPAVSEVKAFGYDGWFSTSPRQDDLAGLFVEPRETPAIPAQAVSPEGDDGPEIMVAEDYPPNRVLLDYLLRSMGLRTVLLERGDQVLPALRARRPAVLLLDLHMPAVDGFEITQAWRQHERAEGISGSRRLPIVAVSASVLEADRQRALSLGMNEFVEKPIDPQRLRAVLSTWLPHHPGLR